jgi:L-threonylcarbamoyladenylate synthase
MRTAVYTLDQVHPDAAVLVEAASVLRGGGLVAFPTETVYGLGANALDASAVARIFAAKGRPAHNPLIVHVAEAVEVRRVAAAWPDEAARLAERFWPGPLTLVLRKQQTVPDVVTAGGPTVAVRVPAHPVARALIRAAGVPLAAPSANRSTELSPTRAEHVLRGLDGRIEMLLDAGPTAGGIESTVLDLTSSPPRLLRPGLIGLAELASLIGPVSQVAASRESAHSLRSPGMLPRHYAPRTPLECIEAGAAERIAALLREGKRLGWVPFGDAGPTPPGVRLGILPTDPVAYAAGLYAVLHELDAAGLDCIVVTLPPDTENWLAVRDRLRRAAMGGEVLE